MVTITLNDPIFAKLQYLADQHGTSIETIVEKAVDNLNLSNEPEQAHYFKNEDHLTAIIDLSMVAIISIDDEQRIILFNHGAEIMFGYAEDEILGKSLNSLLPESTIDRHSQYVKDFARSDINQKNMSERLLIHGKRCDDTIFPIKASISKFFQNERMIATVILQDMSEETEAKKKLHDSETRYRAISELSADYSYAYAIDPDGKAVIEWVTEAFEEITGYPTSLLDNPDAWQILIHPDDHEKMKILNQQLRVGELILADMIRILTMSGKIRYLAMRYRSVWDEQEARVVRIYGTAQDVTDRKLAEDALRQERNLLNDIMETSPAGITVVNPAGQITFTNKRAESTLRLQKNELTNRSYDAYAWKHTDWNGGSWLDEQQPFVRIMKTKQPVWNVRHAIEAPDGERIYLAINGIPQLDQNGEVKQIIFAIDDVTLQKQWEDEIKKALEREIEVNIMRNRFLSLVSHEFRTPLSVIMTTSDILLRYGERIDEESRLSRLKIIQSQVNRLNTMIEDVMFMNKAQFIDRELERKEIDLDDFCMEVIRDVGLAYPESKAIEYLPDNPGVIVNLDEMLLIQILMNLLTNAVKYSPIDKPVTLKTSYSLKEITIIVKDEGIGIPEEDQEALFNAFYRASNVGDIKGVGLGLVIIQQAVENHKGILRFESDTNSGTIFTVTLPL